MANTIQIKRGSGAPIAGSLQAHELGWDYTNNSLYIGVTDPLVAPIKIADAFEGYLTLDSSGNLTVSQNLTVSGTTTLSSTLDVTGLASLDGGIDVDGAFTVADTTGNISTSGTLDVTGATNIGGALEVDGNVGIDGSVRVGAGGNSHFSVNGANGNTSVGGTLGVTGATTLSSTLGVTGATTLTGALTANGAVTVNNNLSITGANTLTVGGNTSLSTVTATGLASLDGGIDVNSFMTVDAANGDIATAGDLTAQNATINGDLIVHGTTTTVNSTTVEIADPIFTLGETLATSDAKDRGIEIKYGETATPLVGFFGLDESNGRFTFIPDAVNTAEVFSGAVGDFEVGDIYQGGTNVSQNWNAAAAALGISGGTGGVSNATQYDILLGDASGVMQPTKTIPAAAGISIDCGTY